MTTSKSFLAKYAGRCPNCGNRYVVGRDWLHFVDNVLQHVTCPTANRPALGTHVIKHAQSSSSSINVPQPIDEASDDLSDALTATIEKVEAESFPRAEAKSFIPSQYQQAIFDRIVDMVKKVANIARHLVIEAVAGSGKTTTIVKALELIPATLQIIFLAFNKTIATELAKRCQALGLNNVLALTLHSCGLRNFKKAFPDFDPKTGIEDDKVGILLEDIYPVSKQAMKEGLITAEQRKLNYAKRFAMRKVVSIVKNTLTDEKDVNAVMAIIERYNVDVDEDLLDEIIEKLPEVIKRCKERTDIIDFDDMIWLCVVLNLPLEKTDFLMVDETQDLNKLQIEFVLRMVKDDGHIIAVGDRFQSLYGFRGADTDAIPNIIEALKADVLPLSVTYRCPASHVRDAQQIVPQLQARDNAPEGTRRELDYYELTKELQDGDMVICRTNGPLVRPAFECIRRGKKAVIRGKEIGEDLVRLVERFETDDLAAFEVSLAQYFEQEYTKLMDRSKEMKALLLQDKVQTLQFIINECKTVGELKSKIKLLFSDNNVGIVFSSVHRAKGLEAQNVYILRPDLMPFPKAKQPWEKQQEMNCMYVAKTRSKDTLVYVTGGQNA